MTKYHAKRAQVTIEFAMVVICIIAALLAMRYYVKRAAQGRLREAADSIGGQYDPRHIKAEITFTQKGTTRVEAKAVREKSGEAEEGFIDGVRTTTTTKDETSGRTGYEQLEATSGGGLFD